MAFLVNDTTLVTVRLGTKHQGTSLNTSNETMSLFIIYFFRYTDVFLMLKSYDVMVEKRVLDSVFLTREIPTYFSSSRTTHYTDTVKELHKLDLLLRLFTVLIHKLQEEIKKTNEIL